MAIEKDI